jgi:hypothetical protein
MLDPVLSCPCNVNQENNMSRVEKMTLPENVTLCMSADGVACDAAAGIVYDKP